MTLRRLRPIPPLSVAATAMLGLSAAPAAAQQQDSQLWMQVNTNVPVSDGVRVTLEQIGRLSDRQGGLYQTEFGALLGLRAAKGVEFGVGYRKVGAHNGNTAGNEDRLRQQVVATFGRLSTRFRVDERLSVRAGGVGVRIRPLVRYNLPVARSGLALFASHESFVLPNSTRWGQRSGYERMRNIVGVMVPLTAQMSADIGYLNQFRPARRDSRAQMDHALTVQLTINLRDLDLPLLHD